MNGSCHCGQVTIRVPGRPTYLNECNCTFCQKLGAMWGYYPRGEVEIAGETGFYVRGDVPNPSIGAHFCNACGATIDWSALREGEFERMGVNMRLFDPAELVGVELRFGDRRNHGTNPRHYYRESVAFDGLGAKP